MKCLALGEYAIVNLKFRTGFGAGPSVCLLVQMPLNESAHSTQCLREIWRADLFPGNPLQRFFLETETRSPLEGKDAEDPIAWVLEELRNLPAMLERMALQFGKHSLNNIAKELTIIDISNELVMIETWLCNSAQLARQPA